MSSYPNSLTFGLPPVFDDPCLLLSVHGHLLPVTAVERSVVQPGEVCSVVVFLPISLLGVKESVPGHDPAPVAQALIIYLLWVELCPWSNSYVGFLTPSALECAPPLFFLMKYS